ncbi:sensor domain-containing protein [Paraburkholderia sp.]|jgi:diguanylate cyclase (GGDEF)-like protein|uniref:sensor domain-containing protein n=1 Tax=Paraburkholderia sp. TaxID=1926495 RepID=UPI002F40975C
MLDSLTDGLMSFDLAWRFTYVNRTAERLLRSDRGKLIGQIVWERYADLVGSGYYNAYHEAARVRKPCSHTDYYAPLATWFEARAFPHQDGITVLFRDVSEEHRQAAILQHQATHDYLTDLPNRRQCVKVLDLAVQELSARPSGYDGALAVLFIDLDRFKEINDAFGHAEGDRVLRHVAARLHDLAGPSGFVARVGGDEFVLILGNTSDVEAKEIAQAILATLADPFQMPEICVSLGASIGIALGRDAAQSAETLLKRADAAMYVAKSSGRFQLQVYGQALCESHGERLRLRGDFEASLASNQVELHFQPQLNLTDGSLRGAEALLRWRHPRRGLLAPGEFLDAIVDSPLEGPLTRWVIDATCRHLAESLDDGAAPPMVSFNLSARQLVTARLADTILQSANRYGVPATMLEVEVTENSLMTDMQVASQILADLRQAGISTSLDDFGSGYSSLAYLMHLPVNTLKIDKAFVWALGNEPNAVAIIRTVVTLAHALNMVTVAEGVETPEQRDMLASEGCDVIQGYLVSRPLPAAEFRAFVRARQATGL